jgi:hypothetical protein
MDMHMSCTQTGQWPGAPFSFNDWCAEDAEMGLLGLSECVMHELWKTQVCNQPLCDPEWFTETECLFVCMGVYEDNSHLECILDSCMWQRAICAEDAVICLP